ncbi:hypothetical protein G6011_06758 [Alternaria panax]|uniref:Uncharacterized protein n=1 Tax=Alternaria panax TaxID=48097 RepID=A0AAD4FIB9_9PLEO|nr:hypothetical protein G6011_06758 [Alternaria panax]
MHVSDLAIGIVAALDREVKIYVHKDGAASGLSMATLGTLEWDFLIYKEKKRARKAAAKERDVDDRNMDDDEEDYLLEEYRNFAKPKMHRKVGFVDWFESTCPFTVGGDSGALVYTTDQSVIIPLGPHIGQTAAKPPKAENKGEQEGKKEVTVFFIEARLLGLRLEFPTEGLEADDEDEDDEDDDEDYENDREDTEVY